MRRPHDAITGTAKSDAQVDVSEPRREIAFVHVRAETRAEFFDPLRAHLRHGDLRLDIAAHERRLTAVGENDALHIGLRDPRVHDS